MKFIRRFSSSHNNIECLIKRIGLDDSSEISTNSLTTTRRRFSGKLFAKGKDKKNIKKVTFNTEVSCNEVLHHNDFTEEEKVECWYSKSQFLQMRREARKIIHLFDNTTPTANENYCIRGLENLTAGRALVKMDIQRRSLLVVLLAQENRRTNNEEIIALHYGIFSKLCALKSYEIGLLDAEQASCIMACDALQKNQEISLIHLPVVTSSSKKKIEMTMTNGRKRNSLKNLPRLSQRKFFSFRRHTTPSRRYSQ